MEKSKKITSKNENISLPILSLFELYSKKYLKEFKLDELIFSVTDKCQFRCKSCFYADTMDNSNLKAVKGLSLEEIKKISSSMGNISKLLITGGEPFLRDDISEICEIFYKQNKIRHIHMPGRTGYGASSGDGAKKIEFTRTHGNVLSKEDPES